MDAWTRQALDCLADVPEQGDLTAAQIDALECLASIRDGVSSLSDYGDEEVQAWIDAVGGPHVIPLLLSDWDDSSIGPLFGPPGVESLELPDPSLFDASPGDYIIEVAASRWPSARETLAQLRREAGMNFLPTAAGPGDELGDPRRPSRVYGSYFFPDDGVKGIVSWEPGIARAGRSFQAIHLTGDTRTLIDDRVVKVSGSSVEIDVERLPEQFEIIWLVFDDVDGRPAVHRSEHGELLVTRRFTYAKANALLEDGPLAWWELANNGSLYRAWKTIASEFITVARRTSREIALEHAWQNLYFVFCKMRTLLLDAADYIEKQDVERFVVRRQTGPKRNPAHSGTVDTLEVSKNALLQRLRSIPRQEITGIQASLLEAFRPHSVKAREQQ